MMPDTIRTPGGRTPRNIADEYNSLLKSLAERKRRMPATAEGLAFAAKMDEIAASVACVAHPDDPGQLAEDFAASEAALEAGRAEFYATVDEFLALDILQARIAERELTPQIVVAGFAPREATANGATV